jgi:hypothetical protein
MARTLLGFADDDPTDDIMTEAENISLLPVDKAHAVPRPDTIGPAYHEDEYDQKAQVQRSLWQAEGERAAHSHTVKAGGLKARVEVIRDRIATAKVRRNEAQAALKNITDALAGYSRRGPLAKRWYLITWFLLLGGDVAGVSGAAIMFGEIPYLAVLQAVAAAVAAVTAGLIGQDIRDARLARRRQCDPAKLTPAQQPYAHLFTGGDIGETIVKAMVYAAITIALLVVGGIWALRAGATDGLAGIVYGCLAGAICLASAINCYIAADEVADLLDQAQLRYDRAEKQLEKLSRSSELLTHGEETAAEASVKTEYEHKSKAAEHAMAALKHSISRRHPGILGHGRPAAVPTTPIPKLSKLELSELLKPRTNSDGR